MKKIVLLLFLAGTFAGMAQKNNEFKIDVFDILALKSLDISYEHEMNADASMGIALLFNFEKTASNFRYNEEFVLTPYYRQYLFDRDNFTYYGEFYGALNMGKKKEEDYTDFAFGLGFGGKHISDNGFVVDIHIGIGRNLFNTDLSPEVVPRAGISIGKRF
jgi:hypothetical protein